MHRRFAKRGMRRQMRVRPRVLCALTPPLLAVTLSVGACGGGDSATLTDHGREARSAGSASRPQAAPARPSERVAAWPRARLLRRIADKIVQVEGRRVRIDRATVTCRGEGRPSRRGREDVWERFACIQPTFGAKSVAGPDAVFRVQPTGPRSFRITDGRFTRY